MADAPNTFDDATTRDLIQLVRLFRRNGWFENPPKQISQAANQPTPIYVHNDSGETIPAYACMQVTGAEEIGSQNFLTVDKPADTDGTSGWYLFNGPQAIADDDEGLAQSGSVVRAYKNSGAVTAGDEWGPTSGQWYVSSGTGSFIAAGEDDVATNVLKLFTAVGGGSDGVTLYRFTLNASLASGTADADILLMDGTDTTIDDDVLDPLGIFASLTSVGATGLCLLQGGNYYVIQANCPA